MPAIVYRSAFTEDVPAMAELRSASGWTGGAGAETMRRYLIGEHHPQGALSARAAFVAEAEGALAGFIAGHLTTRFGCDGELQWLLVAPPWRGSAVAERLLQLLAAWFATQPAARVCVNVTSENVRARRFFRPVRRGRVVGGMDGVAEYYRRASGIALSVHRSSRLTRSHRSSLRS